MFFYKLRIKSTFDIAYLRWIWLIPIVLFLITLWLSYNLQQQNYEKARIIFSIYENAIISELKNELKDNAKIESFFTDKNYKLHVQIFDYKQNAPETLIADNAPNRQPSQWKLATTQKLNIAGQNYIVRFAPLENFAPFINKNQPILIFIFGTGLSLFAFIALWLFKRHAFSEERFHQTVKNAPIGIAVVGLEGQFLQVSQVLCDMVGYSEEELLRTNFQSITHPDDLPRDLNRLHKLSSGEISAYKLEKRYLHKKGHIIWALLTVGSVRDERGKPQYYISQILNITERKAHEESQQRMLQELTKANEELEKFAYVASHDLKTPLRGIQNLAGWIAEDLDDVMDDETRKRMDMLRNRVTRLEIMLKDILEYSRAGKIIEKPQDIDVNEALNTVAEGLNIPKGFTVNVPDEKLRIYSPRTPLEQVFTNLLANALKHHDRDTGQVDVSWKDNGTMLEFAIQDDGPGIPPQFHDKVFTMFQTLKPRDQTEGTGLGMAIAKKLVEWQGGHIWIESEEGKRGTVIKFTWPKRSKNKEHI